MLTGFHRTISVTLDAQSRQQPPSVERAALGLSPLAGRRGVAVPARASERQPVQGAATVSDQEDERTGEKEPRVTVFEHIV